MEKLISGNNLIFTHLHVASLSECLTVELLVRNWRAEMIPGNRALLGLCSLNFYNRDVGMEMQRSKLIWLLTGSIDLSKTTSLRSIFGRLRFTPVNQILIRT